MTDDKIILPESDEAAQYRTLTGWVDRHGRYWADDERMARWSGATHLHCDTCGAVIRKHGYTICDDCREERDVAAYNKYKTQPHDGGWCYSEAHECFFEDEDEVEEYMAENNVTWDDLRMCATTPNYLFTIDEDTWSDVLHEDGPGLPSAVDEALSVLNSAIEKSEPISFSPTKIALTRVIELEKEKKDD